MGPWSFAAGYRGARTIIHAGPPEADTEAGSTFIPDIKARVVSDDLPGSRLVMLVTLMWHSDWEPTLQVNELKPGVVLVAKPWEYNHFYNKVRGHALLLVRRLAVLMWSVAGVSLLLLLLSQACLFVYQVDADKGCRAVIMEKPTAFTLSDLAPSLFSESPFAGSTIFLGGDVSETQHEDSRQTATKAGRRGQGKARLPLVSHKAPPVFGVCRGVVVVHAVRRRHGHRAAPVPAHPGRKARGRGHLLRG